MFVDNTLVSKYNARAPFDDTNAASPRTKGLGTILHETKNLMKVVYDLSVLGGATGDIALLDDLGNPAMLPANAIVTRSWVDVQTVPTSGGSATVALKVKTAADLLGATAIASITGMVEGVQTGAASAFVKLTADSQVKATVAVAALTAGKFNVFLEYVVSN